MFTSLVLALALLAAPGRAIPNPGSVITAGQWPETDKYLTVRCGQMENGTPVEINTLNVNNNRQWQAWVRPDMPGVGPSFNTRFKRSLRVAGTAFCLDAGTDPRDGSKVKIWQCYDGLKQQTWESYNNGYRIVGTNLCLDKTDGKDIAGTQVQVWTCFQGNSNQFWGGVSRGPCGPFACTTWPYPDSTPTVTYRR